MLLLPLALALAVPVHNFSNGDVIHLYSHETTAGSLPQIWCNNDWYSGLCPVSMVCRRERVAGSPPWACTTKRQVDALCPLTGGIDCDWIDPEQRTVARNNTCRLIGHLSCVLTQHDAWLLLALSCVLLLFL